MEKIGNEFFYVDTGEATVTAAPRPCGKCGEFNTPEGHDACLGTIPGPVINACCGHGDDRCAYIQFNDGTDLRGTAALEHFINMGDTNGK